MKNYFDFILEIGNCDGEETRMVCIELTASQPVDSVMSFTSLPYDEQVDLLAQVDEIFNNKIYDLDDDAAYYILAGIVSAEEAEELGYDTF